MVRIGKKIKKLAKEYPAGRKKRIGKFWRNKSLAYRDEMQEIFKTAEKILTLGLKPNRQFIFIGQGMRSLFEATAGINRITHTVGRKNLRYFVTPDSIMRMETPRVAASHITSKLKNGKIIAPGKGTVYVIDAKSTVNKTFGLMKHAIKKINPKKRVIQIHQLQEHYGEGVRIASLVERPTQKSESGKLSKSPFKEKRDEYLAFQNELKEYLRDKLRIAKQLK